MKNKAGFTLIELLSVVLIIGILTSVALPQYRRAMRKAKITEAISMLRIINDSAQRLAAGYGYRDFSTFLSSSDYEKFNFQQLDMFDNDSIKCAFDGGGKTMTCEHFEYAVARVNGPNKVGVGVTYRLGVITATGRFSGSNNIVLTMIADQAVPTINCTPNDVCESYGFYERQ